MSLTPRPVTEPAWFKSSYSGGNTTECVEAAFVIPGVLVRDSKTGNGPAVPIPNTAWTTFVQALKQSWLGQSAAKGQRPR
ncbi:DUF397 domain-containing protein [Streptomyces sp. NPDC091279]|uniref:DUF397 domain-containing protein n=1 Tax=unclassified Streptomyces TaxID=2593676 RepID=UPI00381D7CB6